MEPEAPGDDFFILDDLLDSNDDDDDPFGDNMDESANDDDDIFDNMDDDIFDDDDDDDEKDNVIFGERKDEESQPQRGPNTETDFYRPEPTTAPGPMEAILSTARETSSQDAASALADKLPNPTDGRIAAAIQRIAQSNRESFAPFRLTAQQLARVQRDGRRQDGGGDDDVIERARTEGKFVNSYGHVVDDMETIRAFVLEQSRHPEWTKVFANQMSQCIESGEAVYVPEKLTAEAKLDFLRPANPHGKRPWERPCVLGHRCNSFLAAQALGKPGFACREFVNERERAAWDAARAAGMEPRAPGRDPSHCVRCIDLSATRAVMMATDAKPTPMFMHQLYRHEFGIVGGFDVSMLLAHQGTDRGIVAPIVRHRDSAYVYVVMGGSPRWEYAATGVLFR